MALTESDWSDIRDQFLHDQNQTYLNTGSWGVLPRPVFDAYTARLRELELNPTRKRNALRKYLTDARETFADHLNVAHEDIAFLPNVTAAINMVVNGFDWQPGDQILTTDQEYGAILNCLHNAGVRHGVEVVTADIPIPPAGPSDILEPLRAGFTDRTRLVVISHITTRTGLIAPLREVSDLAHEHGALVAFDGAHAPGMIPLDLGASGADFYGGNCHKWLCSPKGVGFLYAHPDAQKHLRHLIVSWGYDWNGMQPGKDRLEINGAPCMWGLEAWGTTDLAAQSAVGDAVRFQRDVGIDAIAARGRELSGYVRSQVDRREWATVVSPSDPAMYGSITTCRFEGLGGLGLTAALYEQFGITIPVFEEGADCSMRVSTHLYNTFAEVDTFFETIDAIRADPAQVRSSR